MASVNGQDGSGSGIVPPTTFGVWGDSQSGDGVLGTSSSDAGVVGISTSSHGVQGVTETPSGLQPPSAAGVWGDSHDGNGVVGTSSASEGVRGQAEGNAAGIAGYNVDPGQGAGVWGQSDHGEGVHGETRGEVAAVAAFNRDPGHGPGVYGHSDHSYGVLGETKAEQFAGVAGVNHARHTGDVFEATAGVYGAGFYGMYAVGQFSGMFCSARGSGGTIGLVVEAFHGMGASVAGGGIGAEVSGDQIGLIATARSTAPGASAAGFVGDVNVWGTLHKFGGGFRIDHPLHPDSKVFSHSFVESSERKNIYDGVVKLDAKGQATVKLPSWFEAINGNLRYQLTPIGGPAPNLHVAAKMSNGLLKIAGGRPKSDVCWQITGVRIDPWAKAHPVVVEETKPPSERHYYLDPRLYRKPMEKGILWKSHPELAKHQKKILEKKSLSPSVPKRSPYPQTSARVGPVSPSPSTRSSAGAKTSGARHRKPGAPGSRPAFGR